PGRGWLRPGWSRGPDGAAGPAQPGRVIRSSWLSVAGSPSRSIAVIFPPERVKLKTTRGWPPLAHTRPATPSMSASLAALARPEKNPATCCAPRVSASVPIRTTVWSARSTTSGSSIVTSAPRSPLREAARNARTISRRRAHRVGQHRLVLRPGAVRARGDLVGQMRAGRILTPDLAGLEHVQRHPGHHRGQPAAQVLHLAGVRAG